MGNEIFDSPEDREAYNMATMAELPRSYFENTKGKLKKQKEASRDNAGKPKLSYLLEFPEATKELVRVCDKGAEKYSRNNWKKGNRPILEYIDSCLRHLSSFSNGQDKDEELDTYHLANAAWNCLALLELYINKKVKDNRDV